MNTNTVYAGEDRGEDRGEDCGEDRGVYTLGVRNSICGEDE